eukprot:scaffold32279_cov109-Isochrysis_galbana.AAC.1
MSRLFLLGVAGSAALKIGPLGGATVRPALRPSPPAVATAPSPAAWALPLMLSQMPLPAVAADDGFSSASYYTTLALYVLAFPGVYSLVKRSTKSKVVQKTYEVAGPAAPAGRPTRELAGDILAFFQANNYKVKDRGEVIVFEGVQAPLAGRAAFLTFCVFISLASLALVLTILEQSVFGEGNGIGNLWYLSTLVSPVAGKYYLDNAERTEIFKVRIVTSDDEATSDVSVEGDDEEVDRFQRTLDLSEKGMVRVKGLFEA